MFEPLVSSVARNRCIECLRHGDGSCLGAFPVQGTAHGAREKTARVRIVRTVLACNADVEGGWKGLVARADAMVYRAKAEGRGRCVLAPQEIPQLPARQLRAS
jgi:hypothetical protein